MDHSKFLGFVRQFPQIWDRNCSQFRDKTLKDEAWERIGLAINAPAAACKDAFKSLREKYIREREKQAMFGDKYLPWQHLDLMSFLDPHIVLRKQNPTYEPSKQPQQRQKVDENPHSEPESISNDANGLGSDFDRNLIGLVKQATPIWDRKSNGYPSKQLKYQLWRNIAQTLKTEIGVCMTRWKGLREKYIRQKSRYQEGDGKWEFLDDMSFLDNVIQYRRKHSQDSRVTGGVEYQSHQFWGGSSSYQDPGYDETSSPSDYAIKTETSSNYDSSYDSGLMSSYHHRKRSASDHSEASGSSSMMEKIPRLVESSPVIKGPEQLFGELVTSWLSRKSEREKNAAMVAILQILTK